MKRTAVIPRQPDILIFRGRWRGLEDDGEMIYSIQGQRGEDGSKYSWKFFDQKYEERVKECNRDIL